jgi:protein gp37
MAERSNIEWCDSTWNPWIGCTKVSPACDHCYAERDFDLRRHVVQWGAGQARKRTNAENWKKPVRWNDQPFCECMGCGWRGEVREGTVRRAAGMHPPADMRHCPSCDEPLLKEARRRVFCASLADVFDNDVPQQWRIELLSLILATQNLDWLLLTKRIGNASDMLERAFRAVHHGREGWADNVPAHVWLGATICNQAEADRDIPKLLATPAAVRFLSVEPMLGPVSLAPCWLNKRCGYGDDHDRAMSHCFGCGALGGYSARCAWPSQRIDWVIVGGESGPKARPMHPEWPQSLRDQCAAAGVPFLFKQWGEWLPISQDSANCIDSLYRSNKIAAPHEDRGRIDDLYGRTCKVDTACVQGDGTTLDPISPLAFQQGTDPMLTFRVGKKAAGRLLDGRTHDGFPEVRT